MRASYYRSAIFKFHALRLAAVLCLLFCEPVQAQDFKWVHIPEHLGNDPVFNISGIGDVVTDSEENIYAAGAFRGNIDFDDSAGVEKAIPLAKQSNFFILKLNKDKRLMWVKYFSEAGVDVINTKLSIGSDNKLVVSSELSNVGFDGGLKFQPGNVEVNGTITGNRFGIIAKMDLNGNISHSKLYDLQSVRHTLDKDNNIILAGSSGYYDFDLNLQSKMQFFKLDPNLNIIWEKSFYGEDHLFPGTMVTNSQGDIVFTGIFYDRLVFDGITYTATSHFDSFIGKLDTNGQEKWFKTSDDNVYIKGADNQDNVFLTVWYVDPDIQFGNRVITLPYMSQDEAALLKIDSNGDVVWSKAIYGNGYQQIASLAVNSHNELIIALFTNGVSYFDGNVIVTEDEEATSLLKLDDSGNFINIKEIVKCYPTITTDDLDNIIIGNSFALIKDFDPHPVNTQLRDAKNSESLAFILKLSPCDSDMPSGDASQSFCAARNATVQDIKVDQRSVEWFDSMTSTVPLADTVLLQDGHTYYAARKKIPNCPEIAGRLEVLVEVTPVPAVPSVNGIQPCFAAGMKLSDLNIQGQGLKFYANATGPATVSASAILIPDTVYYVSQKINDCEGPRTPLSISGQSALDPQDYSVYACDTDKNGTEILDLSDYNDFIVHNFSVRGISMSYHKSEKDALQGINPILDYQNYPAGNQKIYVRAFSNLYSCYDVGVLTVHLSDPPEIVKLEVRDWADNNSITVLPLNTNHSYSLDGINFQDSNIFDRLDPGEFEVFVKDNLGVCNPVSKKAFVLGYPKFFTPNGDGINDYWKIKFAVFQFVVDVEIYDRYGKLITGFDKMSIGWDGKLNGKNLPATDYWFRIIRVTNKEIVYRGHFSLVR